MNQELTVADESYVNPPGFWSEAPCMGCGRPLNTTWPSQRACSDCFREMLDGLAARPARTYDPAVAHEWPEAVAILWRLGWGCFTRDGRWTT